MAAGTFLAWRSAILPPQPPPPALAPPASREQPPAWFVEWPEAEQKELQAMVDAIERDAPNGWCNETEIDLQNEFSLSAEQARTIFRCLCSAPLAARLDAERAAEEAAAGGEGGGDGVGDRGGGEGGLDFVRLILEYLPFGEGPQPGESSST